MNRLFDALGNAADGAFVVDDELRIVFWNGSAESILGYERGDVEGAFCYKFLDGHDSKNRMMCSSQCRIAQMMLNSKPVPNYDVRMKTREGDERLLNMSVFSYQLKDDKDKKVIVHMFHERDREPVDDKYLARVIEMIKRYQGRLPDDKVKQKQHGESLTKRETEILTYLAKGYSTREIAKQLSISPNTVRNHIQNIFQKLQVRTRLEAVTHAIKNDLVNI